MDTKTEIPAGIFKQGCLAMRDRVADASIEVVITKRGKSVARRVPLETSSDREAAILAKLCASGDTALSEEEFLRPTSGDAPWNALCHRWCRQNRMS